ncbi:hypothetical protein N9D23_08975 [Rubripirellula sp.]|jgi:hypothetical protein|nr:hypothetical protein [Rubripirellula sp.]MDF1844551.1 hypothetical protein [Rubripirellula sp.]
MKRTVVHLFQLPKSGKPLPKPGEALARISLGGGGNGRQTLDIRVPGDENLKELTETDSQ